MVKRTTRRGMSPLETAMVVVAVALAGCASSRATFEPASRAGLPSGTSAAPAAVEGTFHVVQSGETLFRIAKKYGVSVNELAKQNKISPTARVAAGQKLLLPRGKRSRRLPQPVADAKIDGNKTQAIPGEGPAVAAPGAVWIWPLEGPVASRFGLRGRHHMHAGVDITCPTGTTIIASRGGTVRFSGREGGYGLLVIMDHGDGTISYYAHMSKLIVKVGDKVEQGGRLGLSGRTGHATGPHLHFEIRTNEKPVDPLTVLP